VPSEIDARKRDRDRRRTLDLHVKKNQSATHSPKGGPGYLQKSGTWADTPPGFVQRSTAFEQRTHAGRQLQRRFRTSRMFVAPEYILAGATADVIDGSLGDPTFNGNGMVFISVHEATWRERDVCADACGQQGASFQSLSPAETRHLLPDISQDTQSGSPLASTTQPGRTAAGSSANSHPMVLRQRR